MPMLELEVALEREDACYRTGETVSGTVRMVAADAVEVRGLSATLVWRVHGKGNPHEEEVESVELLAAPRAFQTGGRAEYPFRLILPDGPVSYRGEHLNVDWRVIGRADVPQARDPESEAELRVEPGEGAAAHSVQSGPELKQFSDLPMAGRAAVIGIMVGVVAVVFYVLVIRSDWIVLQIGGVVSLGAVGLVGFRMLRNPLARRRLGSVVLDVPEQALPGETVPVSLSLHPAADVDVQEVTASLRGRERVVRGAGKHRTRHTHELHEEKVVLARGRRLQQRRDYRLEGALRLPPDAPPSLQAPDNRLDWEVEVHVAVAGWPDWVRTERLTVVPRAPGVDPSAAGRISSSAGATHAGG